MATSEALLVAAESPAHPEVVALIDALDAYQQSLYPPESNHLLDLASLQQPHVLFAVARDGGGRVLGCGALVVADADSDGDSDGDGEDRWAEVKRMYVVPEARGRGVARALLGWLHAQALRRGCRALRLETGIHQAEALGLYGRAGFAPRGPFADYAPDPLSVFMERRLPGLGLERIAGPGAEPDLDGLADTLHACVADGASVGFVMPFGATHARRFWEDLRPSLRDGGRVLWQARLDGRVVGTVSLVLQTPPNGRHRAEVSKLLVHPAARRHGIARALMLEAEDEAYRQARSLLVLDTRTGDSAEALYRSLGYRLAGVVPEYARAADGTDRRDATSVMYKILG